MHIHTHFHTYAYIQIQKHPKSSLWTGCHPTLKTTFLSHSYKALKILHNTGQSSRWRSRLIFYFILNTMNYHNSWLSESQSTVLKKPRTPSHNLGQAHHKTQILSYRQYLSILKNKQKKNPAQHQRFIKPLSSQFCEHCFTKMNSFKLGKKKSWQFSSNKSLLDLTHTLLTLPSSPHHPALTSKTVTQLPAQPFIAKISITPKFPSLRL